MTRGTVGTVADRRLQVPVTTGEFERFKEEMQEEIHRLQQDIKFLKQVNRIPEPPHPGGPQPEPPQPPGVEPPPPPPPPPGEPKPPPPPQTD